jgi:arylsulfatase A-like enzyme
LKRARNVDAPLLFGENQTTLASLMQSAGYYTACIGKWHLGFGRHKKGGPDWNGELKPGPLEVGFDYSYVIPIVNSFAPYVFVENHQVEGLREDSPIGDSPYIQNGPMVGGEGARWKHEELADKLTAKVLSQLDSAAKKRKPFFIYYAPHQPHSPYRPHPRFIGTSQAGAYGDFIQELDWSVGEVLNALDRLGLTENTLVVFSSDNGGVGRDFSGHQPNGPTLRGGKGSIYEGGFRVPFLARWPGKIEPGTRSTEVISLTDMLATFTALTGQELPAEAGTDSYNVLPALLGRTLEQPLRGPLVMQPNGSGVRAIREGKWKLIDESIYRNAKAKPGHPELYDLEEDPGESRDLCAQHPEIVQRLRQTLEQMGVKPVAATVADGSAEIEVLSAGKGHRVAGIDNLYNIDTLPDVLAELPCVVIPRGDSSWRAPGFKFQISAPADIYLAVHDRGGYEPGVDWKKIDLKLLWGKGQTDTVYLKSFKAGVVEIPGHTGQSGAYFGIPHTAFVKGTGVVVAPVTK